MPTITPYRTKDGRTTFRVRVRDALGRQTTETFTTEKSAAAFCRLVDAVGPAEALADRARRDRAETSAYMPTLAEWLPSHIAQLTGVEDRTRVDYARMAGRTFLPALGALPLDRIDRPTVAAVVNELSRRGLSDKSIKNAHGLLSAVFASAMAERHIDWNPCYKMRLPRTTEHERRDERFLTHHEYERLLEAFPAAHRPLLVTLFGTGLRWSEATSLTVGDFRDAVAPDQWDSLGSPPTLRVTKAWKLQPGAGWKVGPPKSLKSRRIVMLPAQVVEAIRPLLDRPKDALLFTAPRGGTVYHGWWRGRVWVPACIAAGLATPRPDVTVDPAGHRAWRYDGPRIHDARHTHASWLIQQGATLEMVQDQLGHESILTTRKVYGALQPAMRNALADMATRSMTARALATPVVAIGS